MRTRQLSALLSLCVALSIIPAACSNSSGDSGTSSSGTTLSTDVANTDLAGSSTSTPITDTATTAISTSPASPTSVATTLAVGASISLRDDGLGDALFGAEPEGVIAYLKSLLGPPNGDTGWVSAPERTCPGTEVRSVSWGDLGLLFGDQSLVSSQRRHFFEWSYGPPAGEVIAPLGMTTPAPGRIGIGSNVTQLRSAYPAATLFAGDELVGPSASITDGLVAYLTNTGPSGVIKSLVGGHGCGE